MVRVVSQRAGVLLEYLHPPTAEVQMLIAPHQEVLSIGVLLDMVSGLVMTVFVNILEAPVRYAYLHQMLALEDMILVKITHGAANG